MHEGRVVALVNLLQGLVFLIMDLFFRFCYSLIQHLVELIYYKEIFKFEDLFGSRDSIGKDALWENA